MDNLQKEINEMKASLAAMEKKLEDSKKKPKGRFKPKKGDPVYILLGDGDVCPVPYTNTQHKAMGNCYRTKEEAETAAERHKAIVRVSDKIEELNDGWYPDWDSHDQAKHSIGFTTSYKEGCFSLKVSWCDRMPLEIPYIKNTAICHLIMDTMKDDLDLIWGVK